MTSSALPASSVLCGAVVCFTCSLPRRHVPSFSRCVPALVSAVTLCVSFALLCFLSIRNLGCATHNQQGYSSQDTLLGWIDLEGCVKARLTSWRCLKRSAVDKRKLGSSATPYVPITLSQQSDGTKDAPKQQDTPLSGVTVVRAGALNGSTRCVPVSGPSYGSHKLASMEESHLGPKEVFGVELTTPDTTFVLCPDQNAAIEGERKRAQELIQAGHKLQEQAETRASGAAEQEMAKKLQLEGSMKLHEGNAILEKLEALAPDEEAKRWHSALCGAIERRNTAIQAVTADPALLEPLDQIQLSMLSEETVYILLALQLSKLGPWGLPVTALRLIESIRRRPTVRLPYMVTARSTGSRSAATTGRHGTGRSAAPAGSERSTSSPGSAGAGTFRGRVLALKAVYGIVRIEGKGKEVCCNSRPGC